MGSGESGIWGQWDLELSFSCLGIEMLFKVHTNLELHI